MDEVMLKTVEELNRSYALKRKYRIKELQKELYSKRLERLLLLQKQEENYVRTTFSKRRIVKDEMVKREIEDSLFTNTGEQRALNNLIRKLKEQNGGAISGE
jgi:hypothetical protein